MENGGPAFACAAENGHQPGMSLRDYFGAQALNACINYYGTALEYDAASKVADAAYRVADAMLAERDKAPAPVTGVT